MNMSNVSNQLRSQQATDSYNETLNGATAQATIGVTTTQPPTPLEANAPKGENEPAVVALSASAQIFTRALQAANEVPTARSDRLVAAQATMDQDLTPQDMSRLATKLLNS